jgi:ribosome modulation factor
VARRLRSNRNAETAAAATAERIRTEKQKAAEARVAAASNVGDDAIVAAVLECGGLKADAETANAAYRNGLKKWEERGVSAEDVTWFLKLRKREVPDVEAEIRRRNRLLRAMAYPLGAQLGLFEDGQSVAAKVDGDKLAAERAAVVKALPTEQDLEEAHAKGFEAGSRGYGEDVNPFQSAEGCPQSLRWLAGRKEGTIEAAKKAFAPVEGDASKSAEDLAGEAAEGMAQLRADAGAQ